MAEIVYKKNLQKRFDISEQTSEKMLSISQKMTEHGKVGLVLGLIGMGASNGAQGMLHGYLAGATALFDTKMDNLHLNYLQKQTLREFNNKVK